MHHGSQATNGIPLFFSCPKNEIPNTAEIEGFVLFFSLSFFDFFFFFFTERVRRHVMLWFDIEHVYTPELLTVPPLGFGEMPEAESR